MAADRDDLDEIEEDDPGEPEPESGEDLFGENAYLDYVEKPELDRYSSGDIDDESVDEDPEDVARARQIADRIVEKRWQERTATIQHNRNQNRMGLPRNLAALLHDPASSDLGSVVSEASFAPSAPSDGPRPPPPPLPVVEGDLTSLSALESDMPSGWEVDEDQGTDDFDISKPKGPLAEWVVSDAVRGGIWRKFRSFLEQYDNGMYRKKITPMVNHRSCSLEVSFAHLAEVEDSILSIWLSDVPTELLEIFDDVATRLTKHEYPDFEALTNSKKVRVRITELPICDNIRDIRQVHLNVFIKVGGVVTRRSVVYPQLRSVMFDCMGCNFVVGPLAQRGDKEVSPSSCPQCQARNSFRVNHSQTIFRNYQTITLQESPGKVPPGRLPRSVECVMLDDLIDSAKPGEEVEVTGTYLNNFDPALNHRQGFPVFATNLEANYVERKAGGHFSHKLTDDDRAAILALSKDPDLVQKMVKSIAPSIHGHTNIKTGILLALLGGREKEVGHHIRGDLNVLLLGDPGTAKSQFLKYVEKTAHRAVYTTGRGSTAVGLTAAVQQDPGTGEWSLEGGALVLADRGVCLIDEFDKMSEHDRTSIHEAMEQQTISISKAGIITTLQARCSVVAAANPVGGKYDESQTFEQNVDMTQPILQRFDLLFVLRDEVDRAKDSALASFVCRSHIQNHPRRRQQRAEAGEADDPGTAGPIPQDMVRKYIMYAQECIHPNVATIDDDRLANLYAELRRESSMGGGVAMGVRHIESIIRLTEAHAKLRLREYCRDDDLDAAIQVFLGCFVSTQKFQARSVLNQKFGKYLSQLNDTHQLLHHLLRMAVQQQLESTKSRKGYFEPRDLCIPYAELVQKAEEHHVYEDNVNDFIASSSFRERFAYDPETKMISQVKPR